MQNAVIQCCSVTSRHAKLITTITFNLFVQVSIGLLKLIELSRVEQTEMLMFGNLRMECGVKSW